MKPIHYSLDKWDRFAMQYDCPVCGRGLARYYYGRANTPDGLRPEQMIDCPKCGCEINWSEEPLAKDYSEVIRGE